MKPCLQCGECCKWVKLPLFNKDEVEWAVTRGLDVPLEDNLEVGDLRYITIYSPCQHLKDNLCSIENEKPEVCKRYYCRRMLDDNSSDSK